VSYIYDHKFTALGKVSLQINQGECIAILGANGSGKSTLLKMMDGLYFPSTGTLEAFGQILTESLFQNEEFNYSYRRQVGLIFQDSDVQLFFPFCLG